jgi:4'-phosphopantetheinyl transferase
MPKRGILHDQVHVWIKPPDIPGPDLHILRSVLDARELGKAGRFRFGIHRSRYITAHGFLRRVLAPYAGRSPEALEFGEAIHGKPYLMPEATPEPVAFNMSHAEDLVVVAVTGNRRVGVDAEPIRAMKDGRLIAARWFSSNEQAILEASPPEERDRMFFRFWTRKEACAKGVGMGTSMNWQAFDTSMRPDASASQRFWNRWWLCDLFVPEGSAGAVAVEGGPSEVRYFTIDRLPSRTSAEWEWKESLPGTATRMESMELNLP